MLKIITICVVAIAAFLLQGQIIYAEDLIILQPGFYYVDKMKGGAKVIKNNNKYALGLYVSDGHIHSSSWSMKCQATERELLCPTEYQDTSTGQDTRGNIRVVPLTDESFMIYLPPNSYSWL